MASAVMNFRVGVHSREWDVLDRIECVMVLQKEAPMMLALLLKSGVRTCGHPEVGLSFLRVAKDRARGRANG